MEKDIILLCSVGHLVDSHDVVLFFTALTTINLALGAHLI